MGRALEACGDVGTSGGLGAWEVIVMVVVARW